MDYYAVRKYAYSLSKNDKHVFMGVHFLYGKQVAFKYRDIIFINIAKLIIKPCYYVALFC